MGLVQERVRAQGLAEPLRTATDVVKRLVGLQAQDGWVAPYAIRARLDPQAAQREPDDAVINWLMRGTLHLVAAEDAAWLTGMLGPVFVAKTRRRRLELGVTDEVLAREVPKLEARLPATRDELLSTVDVPPGQARAHLLAYAGLTGVMVRRGDTFVPMPAGAAVDEPERELAERYVKGYGPADPSDFAAWSGLPVSTAKRVLPKAKATGAKPPQVKLLGHLDPYLLGYKDRSFALDPANTRKVQRGGGFLRPLVLVGGRVHGVWEREWRRGTMVVTVDAWDPIPKRGLEAEVADLGRFFNSEATIAA
ncbi:MAG TPA: crosslink repair DNA glycosylase YcaQ family protein [Candidatus Limnocylindrales bacterium]